MRKHPNFRKNQRGAKENIRILTAPKVQNVFIANTYGMPRDQVYEGQMHRD